MIIMALAPGAMNVNELNDKIDTEYGHGESVANGTSYMAGILSWQDDAWNATWNCEGGLALVTPSDWQDFVNSGEDDPHNYTSWGIIITHADSYEISNAPAGTWVVTAGLSCSDDTGVWRTAGGQFGDDHMNPSTVNLTVDGVMGDVSFMLIEFGEGMGDDPTFICGDGTEIPFNWVNDGEEDCEDGADEQQYDSNGTEINWFDCHGGTQVWIHQVNDGNEDCPDGDDEPHGDGGDCPFLDGPGSPCEPVETNPCYTDHESSECDDYVMEYCESNMDDPGCDDMGEGDCPFDPTVPGSPCEPVATNPCYSDDESPECYDYVMEYCESNMDDPGCDDMGEDGPTFICGDGTEIPFNWVNDGMEDCADGADEQQYDAAGDPINWFDCYGGTQVWIYQVNDGNEDCPDGDDEPHGDEGDCPFYDGPGSPCEPVATNPCFSDGESPECYDYVMEYCATHEDPACDDMGGDEPTYICGDDGEIPLDKVNNGVEDCADGDDEQQYNSDGTPINMFNCGDGVLVWIYQVNDGTEDCPDGDDESHDDDDNGENMCDEMFVEFHLVTSPLGGVNFIFDMVCLISIEQSNEYREYIDMFGDGNGIISDDEIDEFMIMMESCYDDDGNVIDCDDSCYEEDGTEMDCDTDDEEWSINGVIMEMYKTDMMFDKESIMGDGSIKMVSGMTSKHVDLIEGEETVTVSFVNGDSDDDDGDGGPECFEVQVLPSGDWTPTLVSVEPAAEWDLSDIVDGGHAFYGCSTPDTFTAVFEYTGDGHPNGVENLPPICEFKWFMANDTAFEDGHLVTEGPDGDVEIELGAGSYMISVWCKDAEMDSIQVKWEAPALNLTNTYDGDGEVNGWVMFIVPPGLSEEIVVPYSWESEEWSGTGEFHITLDSGEGDGGDVEGDGGGLPGFTSLMTITALLGAVFFLGRRESE